MAKNILVYIDGTEKSLAATEYGIYLSKKLSAKLNVIYVVDVKTLDDLLKSNIFVKAEELDFEHDLEADAKRYLKEVEIMGKEKNVPVSTILAKGEINVETVKKINELDIDLLLLGEIEITETRTDAFYSETERIFRRAKCQVLVVKNEDKVHDLYDEM